MKPLKGKANYQDWADDMTAFLMKEALWGYVDGSEIPTSSDDQEWKKKNGTAFGTLYLSCDREIKNLLKGVSSAKKAWDLLKTKFEYGEDFET